MNSLLKSATSASLDSTPPAVRVKRVVKRYGSTTALAGVDLEVPEGMVFGLLGPNGAGTTTLVRAWIVGIVALFVPLSVWRYRRMS